MANFLPTLKCMATTFTKPAGGRLDMLALLQLVHFGIE
jgi:hypothetical protein